MRVVVMVHGVVVACISDDILISSYAYHSLPDPSLVIPIAPSLINPFV